MDGFGARLYMITLQFYSKVYALSLKHPLAPALEFPMGTSGLRPACVRRQGLLVGPTKGVSTNTEQTRERLKLEPCYLRDLDRWEIIQVTLSKKSKVASESMWRQREL